MAADTQAALPATEIYDHLQLNRPGLEKVKAAVAAKNLDAAGKALLAYYRARSGVHAPLPTRAPKDARRDPPEKQLKIANDALKNTVISQPSYPPKKMGKEIDWRRNPYPDKEWIVQLHRMYWWGPLGQVYRATGDEQYAVCWARQFLHWRKNTPTSFGDGWRTIEMGIRGYQFTCWYAYFLHSESFTPEVMLNLLATCHDHAVRLAPKYHKGSNWGLMESEGLAHIAVVFPEFKQAEAWRKTAIDRLYCEFKNQVYADGMQHERNYSYHGGCIRWFSRTADLFEANDLPLPGDYREKIVAMYHVYANGLKPDGTIPMFGDTKNASGLVHVREGAARYNRADWAYIVAALDGDAKTVPTGVEPQACSAFSPSGHYFFRSGWDTDAIWMALASGPDGGWHDQPVNNTFELYAYGSYLMPDSGCFIYSGDPKNREWFRATKHHQCLTLDGKNIAFKARERLWHDGDNLTALSIDNASYAELTHRRNVFFLFKKFFVIVDEALVKPGTKGDVRLHWQFGPPAAKLREDGSIDLKGRGPGRLRFTVVAGNSRAKKEDAQVAFAYRQKEPRSGFSYALNAQPVFASLLLPYKGAQPSAVEVELLPNAKGEAYAPGANTLRLRVTHEGATYLVTRDLKKKTAALAEE